MNDKSQVAKSAPAQDVQRSMREEQQSVLPAVDVFEDASGITLLIDMPGVPKDRLELKVEGDSLVVEGNAQPQTPPELEPIYAEVRVARFSRHFTLTRELDTTKIDANLKDGVLKLRIPKQEHVKPKRIAVNAG